MNKSFIVDDFRVFFKNTDYHGYLHPYNFLEWTSYVREAFFQETVPNFLDILQRPVKMMTVRISSHHFDETIFGDRIQARLTVARQKKVSFDMVIRFHSAFKNKIICETVHTIVFADSEAGKFAPIPEEMLRVIVNYQETVQGQE